MQNPILNHEPSHGSIPDQSESCYIDCPPAIPTPCHNTIFKKAPVSDSSSEGTQSFYTECPPAVAVSGQNCAFLDTRSENPHSQNSDICFLPPYSEGSDGLHVKCQTGMPTLNISHMDSKKADSSDPEGKKLHIDCPDSLHFPCKRFENQNCNNRGRGNRSIAFAKEGNNSGRWLREISKVAGLRGKRNVVNTNTFKKRTHRGPCVCSKIRRTLAYLKKPGPRTRGMPRKLNRPLYLNPDGDYQHICNYVCTLCGKKFGDSPEEPEVIQINDLSPTGLPEVIQVSDSSPTGPEPETALRAQQEILPSERLKIPVGLDNLGNTCYINAIVQALYHIPLFREKILEQSKLDLSVDGSRGTLFYSIQALFTAMESSASMNGRPISPSSLIESLRALKNYRRTFDMYDEQDAHEFLFFLLDAADNSLNEAIPFLEPIMPGMFQGRIEYITTC